MVFNSKEKDNNASLGRTATPGSSLADDHELGLSARNLFLRDSVVFLVLLLSTAALYGITSFLFHSFASRRQQLAAQFSTSGERALRIGKPAQAIEDLRTALEYAPDDLPSHLLLADALAQGHHTEEATNYFLTLREAEPADGFINLQLARLYRAKGDSSHAIEFYRAAALGNWNQDGVAQRLQAQLELSEYLLQLGEQRSARAELLMAAGNAPDSVSVNLRLGDELRQVNDPAAALGRYQKAAELDPQNFTALSKAGSQAYEMNDYVDARRLLEQALKEQPDTPEKSQLSVLLSNSVRLLQLSPYGNLPAQERVEHIRAAAAIAQQRFNLCSAQFPATALPPPLQNLKTSWQQLAPSINRGLAQNTVGQGDAIQLIFDTEIQTSQICGAPSGDDALLLRLAKTSQGGQQGKP